MTRRLKRRTCGRRETGEGIQNVTLRGQVSAEEGRGHGRETEIGREGTGIDGIIGRARDQERGGGDRAVGIERGTVKGHGENENMIIGREIDRMTRDAGEVRVDHGHRTA